LKKRRGNTKIKLLKQKASRRNIRFIIKKLIVLVRDREYRTTTKSNVYIYIQYFDIFKEINLKIG
jgi:hypothetical protein